MQADGSGQRRLTNHPGRDASPAWSPDGHRIAFASERDGNREIYLVRPDGGNLQRLTHQPAGDDYPLWSPDGAHLAVQVIRREKYDVDLVDVNSGRRTPIGHAPGFEGQFDWSPDGRALLLVSDRSGTNLLYRAELDGRLTSLTTDETLNPDW
jgi:Tol biopolymer transport system component